MSTDRILSVAEIDERIIPPSEFVADDEAFIDVRLPHSQGKRNYSMIGPGVSQNPDQHINLREPHGFNIGAAGVPAGGVNNQHLHFTAEVFVSTVNEWEVRVGIDSDQTFVVPPMSVVSVPTWIFRGFTNLSDSDGMLYAVLGGDDTGGIIWSPKVLHQAASTGLYLRADNTLLDTTSGDELTADTPLVGPMSEQDIANLRVYSDDQLRARMLTPDDLQWSSRALLDSVLPGHSSAMAPVLGWGMTEDRDQAPSIVNPHTFSIEWLHVDAGNRVGFHKTTEPQVVMAMTGALRVTFNRGDAAISRDIEPESFVSIPTGAWRSFEAVGTDDARMLVVNGGDFRNRIEWSVDIVENARAAGWEIDAGGYMAAARILSRQANESAVPIV